MTVPLLERQQRVAGGVGTTDHRLHLLDGQWPLAGLADGTLQVAQRHPKLANLEKADRAAVAIDLVPFGG